MAGWVADLDRAMLFRPIGGQRAAKIETNICARCGGWPATRYVNLTTKAGGRLCEDCEKTPGASGGRGSEVE